MAFATCFEAQSSLLFWHDPEHLNALIDNNKEIDYQKVDRITKSFRKLLRWQIDGFLSFYEYINKLPEGDFASLYFQNHLVVVFPVNDSDLNAYFKQKKINEEERMLRLSIQKERELYKETTGFGEFSKKWQEFNNGVNETQRYLKLFNEVDDYIVE